MKLHGDGDLTTCTAERGGPAILAVNIVHDVSQPWSFHCEMYDVDPMYEVSLPVTHHGPM